MHHNHDCHCGKDPDRYLFPMKPGGCNDPFMSDDMQPIKVDWITKTIAVPKKLRVIGVEGEQNARVLPFEIMRCPYDADITSGIVKVVFQNAAKETGEYLVDDVETNSENMIRFTFTVPGELCVKTGKVLVGINIIHNNYEYHITPGEFWVGKFGDYTPDITPNDPKYNIVNQILLKQQFLESYLNSGNDVDLDGLLEIFETTKLSYAIGELPYPGDEDVNTLYIVPTYKDVEAEDGTVTSEFFGYEMYMYIEDEWKLLASSAKLISYNDLLDKPHIPTKVSELENDVGYQTNAIEEIEIKGQIISAIDKSLSLDDGFEEISTADLNALYESL